MKKLLLISALMVSGGAWANNYSQCISENMSDMDNITRSACAETIKSHEQNKMNNLLKKIATSKQFDQREKSIIMESQKAFTSYKSKQCSIFTNNGASADGLIAMEFCEIGMIEQRNTLLESLANP